MAVDAATWAEIRRLFEGTTIAITEVSKRFGVGRSTIYEKSRTEGWAPRPKFSPLTEHAATLADSTAPPQHPAEPRTPDTPQARIARLFRLIDLQLDKLENRMTPSDEKGHKPMTTTTTLTPPAMVPAATPKWWGESMTIWGAVLTALATLLPALASMAGVSLSPDIIREAGTHMAAALQALVALSGTIVTIYGRIQARQPLEHRSLSLRL